MAMPEEVSTLDWEVKPWPRECLDGTKDVRLGKLWIKQLLIGAFLVPVMICGAAFLVNFISIYYGSSRSIPFTVMLSVTAICLFIILPLTAAGTLLGRNISGTANYPCRTNAVPRPIPEKKWFMEPNVIILASGILPFGSIFIEMYFIFTSFWAYKVNLSSTVHRRSTRLSLDLLCLRFYVARLSHSRRGHCLCDDRCHVFLTQCRRLSMVNFPTRDQLMHRENIRFSPEQME